MESTVPHARIEEWLRHEGFLRRTLRALLASEADVEDALQQTWTKLLERPGAAPLEARGWLTRVARNVAIGGLRARQRRADHEAAATTRASDDSPAESAARMEALQHVVAAILALDEPYRSVVLLRHEQELDASAIARKLGRSEATVRSQLSRAHELLRRKLDRDFGGRERWAALAVPLALRSGAGVAGLVAGGALLVGVVALGLWLWSGRVASTVTPTLAAASTVALAPVPQPEPARSVREPLTLAASLLPAAPTSAPVTQAPAYERLLPAAELLDRRHYDDYGRATYSFEHGLRDDPDLAITRNDWDLLFSGGQFDVCTVTNDRSLVADLGVLDPLQLDGVVLAGHELGEFATVSVGHAYFVWTLDDETDLACLVVVREHELGRRCLLDWYATDGSGRAQGSLQDDGLGERLVDALVRLRAEARVGLGLLLRPEVLLQARMGAGGGNESRLCMNGTAVRLDRLEEEPLDLGGVLERSEDARGHVQGGWIPDGQSFVVTQATYAGRALGDSNGPGLFALVVDGEELVRQESSPEPVEGTWSGALVLEPGDENRTYLALANSSAGEARLFGYFAPSTRTGFGAANAGFFTTVAPAEPPEPALVAPRAVLQARASHGGGNPVSVTLHGATSNYVDREESFRLDFSTPPESHDPQLVHWEGGVVPAGQVFVVTHASWWSATYNESTHSQVVLRVAGEALLEREGVGAPESGSWSGRLEVLPGEESRTSLEVSYFAAADVLLTGHFEPR